MILKAFVLDPLGRLHESRVEAGPLLGGVKGMAIPLAGPKHVDQRRWFRQDFCKGIPRSAGHHVIRIAAVGQESELQGAPRLKMRQGRVHGPVCGFLPCLVTVEAKHRQGRHCPQQTELIGGQRGPERRHGVCEAAPVERDHIHIAFRDNDGFRSFSPPRAPPQD